LVDAAEPDSIFDALPDPQEFYMGECGRDLDGAVLFQRIDRRVEAA
jgi:hypothetical protein